MKNYRRAKSILCIVLIVCYAVGMVCMFVNAFPIGLALWAVSLVGGLAVLYRIHVEENKAAFGASRPMARLLSQGAAHVAGDRLRQGRGHGEDGS